VSVSENRVWPGSPIHLTNPGQMSQSSSCTSVRTTLTAAHKGLCKPQCLLACLTLMSSFCAVPHSELCPEIQCRSKCVNCCKLFQHIWRGFTKVPEKNISFYYIDYTMIQAITDIITFCITFSKVTLFCILTFRSLWSLRTELSFSQIVLPAQAVWVCLPVLLWTWATWKHVSLDG